ncbi:MAG: penicillin-binding transpeptidase domain-containing protein, partial [Acidobacteriota bacterium]
YYGLSAAIGSVEVSPLEVAALYASLAQDGRYRPLRWLQGAEETEPGERGTKVISPGSAFLTRRALARRDRPDFPSRRKLSGAPARIHWKTGTSYGHRDAWAAGSGPDHTAVVWLGNFDNTPSIDLVGAEAAGPLLFDLLEAVADRSRLPVADRAPHDLKRIEVCAYSGYLPKHACEQRRNALALRHQVPTGRCPYHVGVDVDSHTGLALNPSCRAGRAYERRNYVVWPASIRRFLAQGHRWLPGPPSLAPGCETAGRRTPPAILSPPRGQTLVLLPGVAPSDQEIPLQAESMEAGARLSWFVDGEFLGTAAAEERLWWLPSPGQHEIVVMDEAGLSSRRRLEVRSRSG